MLSPLYEPNVSPKVQGFKQCQEPDQQRVYIIINLYEYNATVFVNKGYSHVCECISKPKVK